MELYQGEEVLKVREISREIGGVTRFEGESSRLVMSFISNRESAPLIALSHGE